MEKNKLIAKISKQAKISTQKAKIAYECVLKESPAFRKQSLKTVKAVKEKAVKVAGKVQVKKVQLTKEKAVKTTNTVEKIKTVEVIKEVPVEVIKTVEVVKEVQVVKEVPVHVVKEIIKEVEVIKQVPVEVLKEITLVHEVEVIKEVEKPVEVIKVVEKKVPVVKEVVNNKALNALKKKYASLEKSYKSSTKKMKDLSSASAKLKSEISGLNKKLKVKPKVVIKEIVKEVPVEIVREVEVLKSIDFKSLQAMMAKMGTVEVSKKVIGETRTAGAGKIVSRREVKSNGNATKTSSKSTKSKTKAKAKSKAKTTKTKAKAKSKKDDLKKIEGIGPKIEQLLNNAKIFTFTGLSKTKSSAIKTILDNAGPRYKMHDPGSWPKQADLAATGKWDALKKLQDKLNGGK